MLRSGRPIRVAPGTAFCSGPWIGAPPPASRGIQLTVSGSTVDVNTALGSGRVSVRGVLIADGAGNLSFSSGPDESPRAAGSYEVADECFVMLVLELPAEEHQAAVIHFRAILVERGREVMGIQTDPERSSHSAAIQIAFASATHFAVMALAGRFTFP